MKSKESLYETFLSMLDDDLRDACMSTRKLFRIDDALPCPYVGIDDIKRLSKAVIETVARCNPGCDQWVPSQYLQDVQEGRERLTEAALAFIALYLPIKDSCLSSVGTLVGMFQHGWTKDHISPGQLIFDELKTGKRCVTTRGGYRLIPSLFARNTDDKRPYDMLHRDGTRGFTLDDDDAVLFYTCYLEIQQRVYKANPTFNFELYVKRPFKVLARHPEKFYSKEEQMEINLKTKVQELRNCYSSNVNCGKDYDLLEQLMIDALLEYLQDPSAPRTARKSYVAQAERLIGDETEPPSTDCAERDLDMEHMA